MVKYSEWLVSVKKIQEMLEAQSGYIRCLIKNNAPEKFIESAKEVYVYYSNLKAKRYKQKYVIGK